MNNWISEFATMIHRDWAQLIELLIVGAFALILAWLVHMVLFRILLRIAANSESAADDLVIRKLKRPSRYAIMALGLVLAAREIPMLEQVWQKVAGFILPALIGWMALTIVHAFVEASRLLSGTDLITDVDARRHQTRLRIFARIASAIIVFVTIGMMLLSIPGVRDIGITLMASAGLAALAVGAAAQPALKSLIAGLQMALTEPIRIGDLIVIDGHTGRVEEIRMNFVLVRTWDERLIIVPTARFFDQSFENWSQSSEALTGPVFLHLDPASDIDPIRAEFERYVSEHELWDGRNVLMLMTEAHPESVELRLAVSSKSIGELWRLRCAVREHMIAWLRQNQPEALIRHRLEVEAANARVKQG